MLLLQIKSRLPFKEGGAAHGDCPLCPPVGGEGKFNILRNAD